MKKLQKLLKAIAIIIKNPYLLNKIIDDENIQKDSLLKKYPALKEGLPIVDFLTILPHFNETISPYSFLNGGSLITDLSLLKGLAKSFKDCIYFEIGTWRGESVSNVSKVANKCYTLNLSDQSLKELGYDNEYLLQQGFYSKNIANIEHLKGNSFDFDFSTYHQKCDLVFVDGDHHFESVLNDTQKAFQLLKNENSIIVWHDYALNPGEIRWDILRGIYEGTPKEKRKNLYYVSNSLCAVYFPKLPNTITEKLSPNKIFTVNIKAEKIG